MKHSYNISTIDYLRDFIVSNNDNMRNNGMTGKSKGDLMKVVYGENYTNVDSALPLGLLDEVGVKNDESWRYVMDYQNNSFGKLTDLINSIAQKNPNVVVYDDSYKELDNLPILSAMKKYKKSNYMFDFDKTQFKKGGGVDDKPSKKEMLDYLNMYFDNYSELRTIAIEEDNILTRKMLNSLDKDGLEMAYEDAKYEIKADTQYKRGGGVREMDWYKGFKKTRPFEMVVVTKEAEKDGGNKIIFNVIVEAQNDTLAYQKARKKWEMEYGLSDLSIVKVYTKDEYVNSKKFAGGGNVELANEKYLNSIPLDKKTRILQNIADHYGISEEQAYEEVTHISSEALYEYITNENLKMHVYQMMK